MKRLIAVASALAVVTCSVCSFAQSSPTKADDIQIMDFKELDKLIAQQGTPDSAKIHVGPRPIRVLLVRPRTTFIPEMYKSIENI